MCENKFRRTLFELLRGTEKQEKREGPVATASQVVFFTRINREAL
jgi:hypothetical protein